MFMTGHTQLKPMSERKYREEQCVKVGQSVGKAAVRELSTLMKALVISCLTRRPLPQLAGDPFLLCGSIIMELMTANSTSTTDWS